MESTIGKAPLKWLNTNDQEQLKWAFRYFGARRHDMPEPTGSARDASIKLVTWLTDLPYDATNRELLALARAAWRQKKCRQQSPGRKTYNFLLHTTVQGSLKQLARLRGKNTTMTEALEELIEESLKEEKRHKKELKKMQEEERNRTNRQVQKLAKTISNLGCATKQLESEVSALSRLLCDLQFRLGSSDNELPPLSEEENKTIDANHQEQLEKIRKRLPLNIRLTAFNSKPSTLTDS